MVNKQLRSAHMRGLVPATIVASCELAIFASKSSRREQLWSLRLVPRIQTSLNFWDMSLRVVPQKALCELFVGQVPAISPFVNSSEHQLQGPIAGTSPLVCADPYAR